jgi:DNA polymerase elongation subunit (family B)
MEEFYTNIFQHKGELLVRGYKNNKPFAKTVNYEPYLFRRSEVSSKYKDIFGNPVEKIKFSSIPEAKDFLRSYEGVEGMNIYGMDQFIYPYIFDTYSSKVKYDPQTISVVCIDIENKIGDEDIDTSIRTTPNEITAITISRNGKRAVFGCGEYTIHQPNITYYKCKDEVELLLKFLNVLWSPEYSPDVLTGWNIEFYDIPYLVGRLTVVLGEKYANRLSPWGIIRPKKTFVNDREMLTYQIMGTSVLDYIALYQKFTYIKQESYSLSHIAFVELGESKLDYSEYGNLQELYENNYQLYIEYNVKDVDLVDRLDSKMGLIELVFTIAYSAGILFNDALASVRPWDVIIHNYLMDRNIVVPPMKSSVMPRKLVGGYVKEPFVGLHNWVVSFDLSSLYPHLIMQYNISPEKFVRKDRIPSIIELLSKVELNSGNSTTMAANGCRYSKDGVGFLPELMMDLFKQRSAHKKTMIQFEKEYEATKNEDLQNDISRYNNLQMALKILLNSAYGALANIYFRWFDFDNAEAITMSGQLSIQWVAQDLNRKLNNMLGTFDVDYIIASDTDSVYIRLDKLVEMYMPGETDKHKITRFLDKVCKEKIEKIIQTSFDDLATYMSGYNNHMNMKREAIANRAIWIAAKRYILNVYDQEGVTYAEPKLKMSGVEAVKSNTPKFCRDSIKQSYKIIMNDTEEDLQKYVEKVRDEFNQLDFIEIGRPTGVSNLTKWAKKSPDNTAGTPIHVRASLVYNAAMKKHKLGNRYETIYSGSKIKYCYLKMPNPVHSNVVAAPGKLPPEFNLENYLDRDLQFTKTYLNPMKLVLEKIGWEAEKTATIMGLFEDDA